ncbi:GTP cyclohydrolase I FolE [Bdellovibrionota bacterium FG-2]
MKSKPTLPKQLGTKALNRIKKDIHSILLSVGEDPSREGLRDTPKRYAKALEYLTSGYRKTPQQVVKDALFTEGSSQIVIVRDIELFSLCEHHMLPFYGKAHVAYIPNSKIIGLSKISRIVDVFARRLQVQERLTNQISQALNDILKPTGVAVIIEAFHLCMMMRGVEKQQSYTITSSMLGDFYNDPDTRKELMSLLGGLGGTARR